MKDEIQDSPENREKMSRVAEGLLGTCKSVDDALCEIFGNDVDLTDFETPLLEHLDDQVMCCEECGWWFETGELNDDQVCTDCAPEEDD